MSTHSSRRSRLDERVRALLDYFDWAYTFDLVTISDACIGRRLGMKSRSASALVKAACDSGRVLRHTTHEYSETKGRFDAKRKLFIVAKRTTLDGARMLATLLRDKGAFVTSMSKDKLCAQLRCAPEQLADYLTYTTAAGWVSFGIGKRADGTEALGYGTTPTFEALAPPGRRMGDDGKLTPLRRRKVWVAPKLSTKTEEAMRELERLIREAAVEGRPPPTVSELAALTGYSRKWTGALLKRMVLLGKLFPLSRGYALWPQPTFDISRIRADIADLATQRGRRVPPSLPREKEARAVFDIYRGEIALSEVHTVVVQNLFERWLDLDTQRREARRQRRALNKYRQSFAAQPPPIVPARSSPPAPWDVFSDDELRRMLRDRLVEREIESIAGIARSDPAYARREAESIVQNYRNVELDRAVEAAVKDAPDSTYALVRRAAELLATGALSRQRDTDRTGWLPRYRP